MAGHNIDESDIYLLYNKPFTLIEKHQETIEIIVNKYIRSGMFSFEERDDIIQTINVRLLEDKIERVQRYFDKSTKLVTYLSRIIQNLCLEIYRQNTREITIDENKMPDTIGSGTTDRSFLGDFIIQGELYRLRALFVMYNTKRPKLELSLKLYFRLPIRQTDVLELHPNADVSMVETMLETLGDDYESVDDKDIYERVTPYLNVLENKHNTPDALRKWVTGKVSEIIHLLNSPPANTKYDKETLGILLTKYYQNAKMTN